MRILTFNLNGIRSAAKKGFFDWLADLPDPVDACLFQELKADESEMAPFTKILHEMGFSHVQWHCAQKKGYAGTGLCSRERPDECSEGFGTEEFDSEGRLCRASYGSLGLASAYFPSGSAGPHRQESKMRFLKAFQPWIRQAQSRGSSFVLGADLNIAHHDLDLKNWKGNIGAPGCTPEERAWMDQWLASGWSDCARSLRPEEAFYTWWSPRAGSRARDVGWRIDAQVCSGPISAQAHECSVHKEPAFSDHAPLIVDYHGSFFDWRSGTAS